jgi:hypothetical protein
MTRLLKVAAVAFTLTTACLAREPLVTVSDKGKHKWPAEEVDKIYLSACAAVQREFGGDRTVRPRVALVLGSDKNGVNPSAGEVVLVKWDRGLFAQGVVVLAFQDLMTVDRRLRIAKRALNWTDATVEVAQMAK